MANRKISELTTATTLNGDELIPFAHNGGNGNLTPNLIKEYSQPDLSEYATKKALDQKADIAMVQNTTFNKIIVYQSADDESPIDYSASSTQGALGFEIDSKNSYLIFTPSSNHSAFKIDIKTQDPAYGGISPEGLASGDDVKNFLEQYYFRYYEVYKTPDRKNGSRFDTFNCVRNVPYRAIGFGTSDGYVYMTLNGDETNMYLDLTTKTVSVAAASDTNNGLALAKDVKDYLESEISWEEL